MNGNPPTRGQEEYLLNQDTSDVWITDSGASRHITFRRDWLIDYRPSSGETVSLGDDGMCAAEETGTVLIDLVNGVWEKGSINSILYVPSMRKNLFSVGVCTEKDFEVRFKRQHVTILFNNSIVSQGIRQRNDIYRMFFRSAKRIEASISGCSIKLWHERLGHVNQRSIKEMAEKGLIKGIKLSEIDKLFCEACPITKSHIRSFKKLDPSTPPKPGEFFHSDVCGPMPVKSIGGSRFFLMFKNDASGFRVVYYMKHKSEVYEHFKAFERQVANKLKKPTKRLRTDNG